VRASWRTGRGSGGADFRRREVHQLLLNGGSGNINNTTSDIEKGTVKENGYVLRWSRISKEVVVSDVTNGLMKGSIYKPDKPETNANPASVKARERTKVILNEISGQASPGEVLAIMGPSGSGKTSLLNVIAGRSSFTGELSVNGDRTDAALMKQLRRKVAYVKQSDLFFDHLTVRDQLTYTALLRLPQALTRVEKYAAVDDIIDTLGLNKCADTTITLLSGGEKKRVNIGTELLTDPSVIILDEPTSGLDSTTAVSLMSMLRGLAKRNGKTVLTSIHQPSSAVFRSFDKLMMMANGHVVYFGTPTDSLLYLKNLNLECPSGYNAADHWMDLLVIDSATDESGRASTDSNDGIVINQVLQGKNATSLLISAWSGETVAKKNDESINQSSSSGLTFGDVKKFNTTWTAQLTVLMHRSMKNSRSAIFTPLNIIKSACIGLMMGLLWFQMEYTESRVNDIVSYYFFTMTYWVFDSMFSALMSFPTERKIILKERASGAYHLSAYFLAKTFSEAPTRLALPCFYMVISYWLAGVNNNFLVFLGSTCTTLLSVLAGESFGLIIGVTVTDPDRALSVMTVTSLSLMVVGGFFVQNIPSFISWIKYLSPFKYAFDASQQIVFNKNVPCDGSGILEMCNDINTTHVTPEEMINWVNAQGSVAFNVTMLIVLFVVPRYIAFLSLKRDKDSERS